MKFGMKASTRKTGSYSGIDPEILKSGVKLIIFIQKYIKS